MSPSTDWLPGRHAFSRFRLPLAFVFALAAIASLRAGRPVSSTLPPPSPDDLAPIAAPVLRLLQENEVDAFVTAFATTSADWVALIKERAADSTRPHFAKEAVRQLEDPAALEASYSPQVVEINRNRLRQAGERLLREAASLGIDFTKGRLGVKTLSPGGNLDVVSPRGLASVTITLSFEPSSSAPDASRLRGDYILTLHHLSRYPGGWRVQDGASWSSLPSAVADSKAQLTLALLGKKGARQGLDQNDDPALVRLAETFARFVQTRDPTVRQNELLAPYVRDFDTFWRMIESHAPADRRPPREEALDHWNQMTASMQASATAFLAQMEEFGIDLRDATLRIRSIAVQSLHGGDDPETIEGLGGSQLRIIYEVQTGALGKTGRPLAGDYTLFVDDIERRDDRWLVNGRSLLWEKLPAGVLDSDALATQEFEAHVARYGTLPPGTPAPDVALVRLDGETPLSLASLRGKVVILDFWATWCGPCQQPMAELQKVLADHPAWADRVVVASISIDDDMPTVRKHLEQRGWKQTLNTWAGPGGWFSPVAKDFRVSAVPTCYLIAPDGRIAGALSVHHPGWDERVESLLAAPTAGSPAAPSAK